MISVVLVQVVLVVTVIFSSGIIQILKENSFNILNQKIESRGNYLQNEMIQHWSNIGESESLINSTILKEIESKGLKVEDVANDGELATELLGSVSDDVIFMLRKNYVTGAFLILDSNSKEKNGVYVRDLDPNSNPSDNSDLLMERGAASIAQNFNIPLDTWWNNKFIFEESNRSSPKEFFLNPINAAKENSRLSYKDLGYWSKPFSLTKKDIPIITYSVPLLDKNNKPYGVLGIAISLKYLNSLLTYEEIDGDGKGVYILGDDDNADMEFEEITSTGPMFNKIIGDHENVKLNKILDSKFIYEVKVHDSDKMAYASTKYLNLYNTNTPFEKEKWALVGLIEKDILLHYSDRFTKLLTISLVISSFVGIGVVIVLGGRVTRPI